MTHGVTVSSSLPSDARKEVAPLELRLAATTGEAGVAFTEGSTGSVAGRRYHSSGVGGSYPVGVECRKQSYAMKVDGPGVEWTAVKCKLEVERP